MTNGDQMAFCSQKYTSLLTLVLGLSACGLKEPAIEAQTEVDSLQSVTLSLPTNSESSLNLTGSGNKMLLIDASEKLRILEPNGSTYNLSEGGKRNLLYAFSEIEKSKLVKSGGDYWRPSESLVWNLNSTRILTLFFDAKSSVWRQFESVVSAPLKPLHFAETGFLALQENKLVKFSFSVNRLQSSSFVWPLPEQKPLAGGLDAGSSFAWALNEQNLVLWNFENGKWKVLPLVATGISFSDIKSMAWKSKTSDFANKKSFALKNWALLNSKSLVIDNLKKDEPLAPIASAPTTAIGTDLPPSLFMTKIKPLAAMHCEFCHSSASVRKFKETLFEASWTGPLKGRIYDEISSGTMPKNSQLSPEDKQTLLDFVKP